MLAALACALVSSPIALAKDVPKERTPPEKIPPALPFAPSERLVYEGEFSKLLLRGIKIAEMTFTASRAPQPATTAAGQQANAGATPLFFTSDIESKGWFRKLFGINFRYHVESTVEPNSFSVIRTSKVDEQGKRVRLSEAVFDPAGKKVEWTERDPNNAGQPPRVVTAVLNGTTHDIISAIYFLRTQRLTPGQTFDLAVSDSGRVYHVPATVSSERKKMKTVIGKAQAIRLDVDIFGEGRPIQGEGKMSLWVTDDERHIPVRARVSHSMGTLELKLKSFNKQGATL